MEKTAYIILTIIAVLWLVGIVVGMIVAFPYGLVGLLAIVGFGLLFIKALTDRLGNKEDDYYSKNVHK